MNTFSGQSMIEKPVPQSPRPGDEVVALRDRAVRVATEEAMSPNLQGSAFVEFVRAELALLDKKINGEPGTSGEDLEARLLDLTNSLDALNVAGDSCDNPGWISRLLALLRAVSRYRERASLGREIRDLKYKLAAACTREDLRRSWTAERLRWITTAYELQKRRAQAAIRIAQAGNSASIAGNENGITQEERNHNEQTRIRAVS